MITITGRGADGATKQADERNKGKIFKTFLPFNDCIGEIDHAKDLDVVKPMCNSIKYVDNYSKRSGSLWQYYRDDPHNTDSRF